MKRTKISTQIVMLKYPTLVSDSTRSRINFDSQRESEQTELWQQQRTNLKIFPRIDGLELCISIDFPCTHYLSVPAWILACLTIKNFKSMLITASSKVKIIILYENVKLLNLLKEWMLTQSILQDVQNELVTL